MAVNKSLMAKEKMNSMVGEERSWPLTSMAVHTNKFPMIVAKIMMISTLAVTIIKPRGDVEPSMLKLAPAVVIKLLLFKQLMFLPVSAVRVKKRKNIGVFTLGFLFFVLKCGASAGNVSMAFKTLIETSVRRLYSPSYSHGEH